MRQRRRGVRGTSVVRTRWRVIKPINGAIHRPNGGWQWADQSLSRFMEVPLRTRDIRNRRGHVGTDVRARRKVRREKREDPGTKEPRKFVCAIRRDGGILILRFEDRRNKNSQEDQRKALAKGKMGRGRPNPIAAMEKWQERCGEGTTWKAL